MRKQRAKQVRICSYPPYWLDKNDSFDTEDEIEWSTGESTRPGDIQIFAIHKHYKEPDTFDDPRVDTVHSIWEATSRARSNVNQDYPVQAEFKLLVRLDPPVPKNALADEGLLSTKFQKWPQNRKGRIHRTKERIEKLADALSRCNPHQKRDIYSALSV
jgi:hypothetical protein